MIAPKEALHRRDAEFAEKIKIYKEIVILSEAKDLLFLCVLRDLRG
jgi:hypothetical protein